MTGGPGGNGGNYRLTTNEDYDESRYEKVRVKRKVFIFVIVEVTWLKG